METPRGLPWMPLLLALVPFSLWLGACGDGITGNRVEFLQTPPAFSNSDSAVFKLEAVDARTGNRCGGCAMRCKLDDYDPATCEGSEISLSGLLDGNHVFEACINGSQGLHCSKYNWIIDTIPPTAYISADSAFTNALNVSVNISFSEPCTKGGRFQCSMSDCNILVYGSGYVIPSTLKVLQPELKYSISVGISSSALYGRLILVMDRSFCADASGNKFRRTENSTFFLHFDRRKVNAFLSTGISEKMLVVNNVMRAVVATNKHSNLRIYLNFSESVLNSSTEILSVLHASTGVLIPSNRSKLGNRRFGFLVRNISSIAITTISLEMNHIISRHGTPVSVTEPTTFLYDAERPSVTLWTSNLRTKEHRVPVLIKFVKPVFGFNSSAVLITGGKIVEFRKVTWSIYAIDVHFWDHIASVKIPENATRDIAGNNNLASDILLVRYYSERTLSAILSYVTTIIFAVTTLAATLLTVSTGTLLSLTTISRSSYSVSEPSRNILRTLYHIQIFAQSKWLAVALPVEYYEFTRGIQWSIPYLNLPWETGSLDASLADSYSIFGKPFQTTDTRTVHLNELPSVESQNNTQYGAPLSQMEYFTIFESQNMKPEAEFIQKSKSSHRWKNFERHMFWLAVIGGGLILLHIVILLNLRLRRKRSEENTTPGALALPRFEIFLLFLALPCICQASTTIIKVQSPGGLIVGILLLALAGISLLSLLVFVSVGITMGKFLQYKEVHQEGQKLHWYEGIVRASLGPGKRGQWTWKGQPESAQLTRLGPLFEDLRGPPKYMLSQISSSGRTSSRHSDNIITSDDENEDSEAPFIQKLFGILRIYYTFIESVKRAALGIVAGAFTSTRSKVPTIVVLSITAFQLFFLGLKKPFIKKKVQIVEIISLASEVGIFATCVVLLEHDDFSMDKQQKIGYFMLLLFFIGFLVQMVNEWYALYRQTVRLSPDERSFLRGLKTAIVGLLLIFLPVKLLSGLDDRLSSDQGAAGKRHESPRRFRKDRNSGGNDRSWIRQLREIAKESFTREDGRPKKDPSSSRARKTGSSSISSPKEFPKITSLQKDLEDIFSSK